MTNCEVKSWEPTRARWSGRYIVNTIVKRCLLFFFLQPYVDTAGTTCSENVLIHEAKAIQTTHRRELANLDEQCANFDPIFKLALAQETFSLAQRARVSEKAAFLALMPQFEN